MHLRKLQVSYILAVTVTVYTTIYYSAEVRSNI